MTCRPRARRSPPRPTAEAPRPRLNVVMPGAAVFIDGKLMFGADQGRAVEALAKLLQEFSPPGKEWTRTFTGKVRVVQGTVPVDKFLASPRPRWPWCIRRWTSRRCTRWWPGIACGGLPKTIDPPLTGCARANPGIDFRYIKAGQMIAVPVGVAPISVQGLEKIVVPAAAGKGTQRELIRYINGVEADHEVVRRPHVNDSDSSGPNGSSGHRANRSRSSRHAAHRHPQPASQSPKEEAACAPDRGTGTGAGSVRTPNQFLRRRRPSHDTASTPRRCRVACCCSSRWWESWCGCCG